MRFFAIAAALVAATSANDAIFLAGDAEKAAEPNAAYDAYLESHKHHATELKEVCATEETAIADANDKTAELYEKAIKCFKEKRLVAQGIGAVKASEVTITGNTDASDELKKCGTNWSASPKLVADVNKYFDCTVAAKGANKAYPTWTLD